MFTPKEGWEARGEAGRENMAFRCHVGPRQTVLKYDVIMLTRVECIRVLYTLTRNGILVLIQSPMMMRDWSERVARVAPCGMVVSGKL